MTTQIKLFAYLAEQVGPTITVTLPEELSGVELKKQIAAQIPQLRYDLGQTRIAVNQTFIKDQALIKLDEFVELAIIPPVSGG